MDAAVVLDATGDGSDVTGTMTVSNDEMSFTVDLECALTAEDGRILIGGDTTESTFDETPTGTRTAIVLKPGTPVRAIFAWQGRDLARAPSCMAFLEDMSPETTGPCSGPIERDRSTRDAVREGCEWRARQDSNLRPLGPEPNALSTELQAREHRRIQGATKIERIRRSATV